mgnify:CR=1 FL=1
MRDDNAFDKGQDWMHVLGVSQPTQQMGGGMKQPQPNATNPQQPNAVGMAQPQPNATNPQAAQVQQPQTAQQPLTPQQMRLQRQNVGFLAKNSAVKK